ncbi:MAG TPA: Rid family hydrolase [Azospirillum sp.]|nr:Rid family hydrolase [Azospirillum sp.]
MTNRTPIFAEKGAKPAGQYSHAITANGFVYVSGQGPHHPETGEKPADFAGEVRQTLRNLAIILEAAGTDLRHVVKVNSYLSDLARFREYNAIYAEFFPTEPPARTTVGCQLNDIQVEIDCIAVLPAGR